MEASSLSNGYFQRWSGYFGSWALGGVAAAAALIVWPFDQPLSNLLCIFCFGQEPLFLWQVMRVIKFFGNGFILFLLGLVLAVHRWKEVAVWSCLAMLIVGVVVTPMKFTFGRVRPYGKDTRSFPSGDAAAVTAFLVPVAKAIPGTAPLAVAGIAAVGTARIVYGYHFPSDVLAGIAIGIFASAIAASLRIPIMKRIRHHLRRSWLAAFLILFPLIRVFFPKARDTKEFLLIFCPVIALLATAPFVRAWLWRRVRRWGTRSLRLEQNRTALEGEHELFKVQTLRWLVKRGWLVKVSFSIGVTALVTVFWFLPVFKLRSSYLEPGNLLNPVIGLVTLVIVLSSLIFKDHVTRHYRTAVLVFAAGLMGLIVGVIVFAFYTASPK